MADYNALDFIESMNAEDVKLTKADESAIVLTALQDVCNAEEYSVIMENLHELELYGLIESAEVANEAKTIRYKQTKQMNLNREQTKAALRIAARANTADWKKYRKGRDMMLAAREAICKKYASKSRAEAKQVLKNAKKKASTMGNTVTGKMISDKLDAKVKEYEK